MTRCPLQFLYISFLSIPLIALAGCASNDPYARARNIDTYEGPNEERLHEIVRDHIQEYGVEADLGDAQVIRKRPYYFREYRAYPEGLEEFDVTLRERDSRTVPLEAEVTLYRERYATQLHKKRKVARQDNEFFRTTGEETIHYELKNGRWQRVGSLFVAGPEHVLRDGEWVEMEKEEPAALPPLREEDDRGWFSRMWSSITGR